MTYFVYILAGSRNGTPYTGVTRDLAHRVAEHRNGTRGGFTSQYGVSRLIYFESFEDIKLAIQREKQLKKWNRVWKLRLIESVNPEWEDLYESILP